MSGISKNLYIKIAILFLILLDVFLVLYSCQNRSQSDLYDNPLIPLSPGIADSLQNLPIYITGEVDGEISTGIGAMGAYYAAIDTKNLTGELTPLRSSEAIGDPYLVDITGYLSGSPCGDCFEIDSIALNHVGEVEVSFSMRHPFDMPAHNPPALNERVDLHVFDVQAIFFFKDSGNLVSFPKVSAQVLKSIGLPETMQTDNSGFWASQNWDGATDHFDDYVDGFWATASSLHPYLTFFEDRSRGNVNPLNPNGFTNVFNPSGHNVFPQGGGPDKRTVNFGSIPNQETGFIVLLSAAYGHSAKFKGTQLGQRGNPVYMLPEYNRKEPWKVSWNIPSVTDELVSGDLQSSTILNVEVYDWQHGYGVVRSGFDPLTDPKDSMSHSSGVVAVYTEIPGVSNLYSMESPKSGTGWGDDPLRYSIQMQNDLGASKGTYLGIIAVTDELHGTNLAGYGIERDGITSFDVKKFVTYALFDVNVIDRGGGSFGMGMSLYDPLDPNEYSGSGVSFDSSGG
ncbi:hypothetical protein KKB99_07155, partial [bacterium]|nr:hypothetical protein [bacterium]MBU1025769.1 hypothetical protein [bacterium]